jgi:non-canonical (house-cleaning) NTP pyrophosphatase
MRLLEMTAEKKVLVVVGSTNRVKIEAVSQAFKRSFPHAHFSISGV